jgi:hypothetical protein
MEKAGLDGGHGWGWEIASEHVENQWRFGGRSGKPNVMPMGYQHGIEHGIDSGPMLISIPFWKACGPGLDPIVRAFLTIC